MRECFLHQPKTKSIRAQGALLRASEVANQATSGLLDVRTQPMNKFHMKLLTPPCKLPYGQVMSQRSSPRSSTETNRPTTVHGLLQLRGTLLLALVLVLLITNGGAG